MLQVLVVLFLGSGPGPAPHAPHFRRAAADAAGHGAVGKRGGCSCSLLEHVFFALWWATNGRELGKCDFLCTPDLGQGKVNKEHPCGS